MAEHSRTICPECGQTLSTSEQADGRCAACKSDDDSTVSHTHSLASTIGLAADHKSRSTTDALEIKDYELIRSIGRGGMGMVYLARQLSVDRLVALKVILDERLAGLPAQQRERAIGRFLNESRAAAQLHHESIVTVFDVGESHGRHYFTMQYVDGVSLSSKLRDGPLTNRVAAQYMHVIARAVHAAHQTGVLHRDLKPANVIVDRATDLPLVADFGLAKMLTNDSDMTMTGEIFGSPPYMSPEQARSARDVTELADIYSLGATLYHLLAGRPPFQAASSLETLKQVIEDEPVSPREVNPTVDVDLETIALKCLNKEGGRRYQSALDLSEDLSAYLDGRTISARPASTWDRVSRWGRRNRAIAIWMSVAAIVLLIGTVTSVTLAFMEHQQRTAAEKNAKRASEQTTRAQEKESEATELADKLKLSLAEVERQRSQSRHDAFTSSLSASFAYLQNAEPQRIDDRLRRLKLTEAEIKEAGFAFQYLNRRARLKPQVVTTHTAATQAAAFSPDNRVIASGGEDFVVELWDSESGRHLPSLTMAKSPVSALAFSLDGKHLAVGTRNESSADHTTRVDIWDYNKRELVTTLPHHCTVHAICFSQNRKLMITATAGAGELGELRVYDTSDWTLAKKLEGHKQGVAGHPWGIADVDILWDSNRLVTAGFDGKVKLWDVEKGSEVRTMSGHSGWVRSIAFDSTGKTVVSGSDDQTIRFWSTETGQQTRILRDGVGVTTTLAYDKNFRSLVTVSELGLVTWDLSSSKASVLGNPKWLNDLSFSNDGRMLATAGRDGHVELWNYEDAGKSLRLKHQGWVSSIDFSPDGHKFATGSGKKSIFVYELPSGKQLLEIGDQPNDVTQILFSPDSKYLASSYPREHPTGRKNYRLWNAETGESLNDIIDPDKTGIEDIAFANQTPLVAIERHVQGRRDGGGYIEIWDLKNGQQVSVIAAKNADDAVFDSMFFSPDDINLYASEGHALGKYEVESSSLLSSNRLGRVLSSKRVNSGQHLLLAADGLYKVDTETGELENLGIMPSAKSVVAMSLDGRWIAFTDHQLTGNKLRIWDCLEQREHGIVDSHLQSINDAVFTSDGRTLITVSKDATIRFWDVASKQDLGVIRDHTEPIYSVDLSPDQQLLVTGGGDALHGIGSGKQGELLLWNATPVADHFRE